MKHRSLYHLLAFCVTLICTLSATAQEKENPSAEAAQDEEMEAWIKFATPGEEHKYLQKLVGEWKTVTKSYEPGADEAQVSEGTAKFESLLGGRYIRQTFKGSMGGMQFEGIGVTGFDNSKQKYVSAWIDSFGTGIMRSEGEYDEKTHALTEIGTSSSPQGSMKWKMVTRYTDEDHFTMAMYLLPPEAEAVKMMDIEYTRVK